jgi:protein disulfide-isomerase A6
MWFSAILATSAASLLFPWPAIAAGLYTKNSPVIQVDANSYDKLIAESNYTSVSNLDPSGETSC